MRERTDMDDNPTSRSQPATFSSEHTRKLVREAELSFGEAIDSAELDEAFAAVGNSINELDEAQFKRLATLTRILAADPDSSEKLESLKRDGAFEIKASEDKMSLLLRVYPPIAHGRPVGVNDILQWMADHQIKCGADPNVMHEAVSSAAAGEIVHDAVIASGQPPVPGTHEKLQLFARSSLDAPLAMVTSSDSLTKDDSPCMCAPGDLILKRIPGETGEPGCDVLGNTLPAPTPETRQIETGRNVRVAGNEYFAEVSGLVLFQQDHLEVRHVLVLTEDVTRQSGPVDFDGQIIIRAGVRAGARVRATGSITVDGPVEAADIESTTGDIELRHGVAGQRRGVIRAEGDVTTRFTENVAVYAGRDITIGTGSLHSQLLAGRAIRLVRGRGHLIGGSAVAGELVEAKQVGSISDVPTEIILGLSRAIMQKLGPIDTELAAVRLQHEQALELADRIERAIGDPSKLTPGELKVYTGLRKRQFVADQHLKRLEERRREVLDEVAQNNTGRVEVHKELMAQVTIRVGDAVLTTSDTRKDCRVVYEAATRQVLIRSLR